jgi:hypothetical protein
MERGSEEGEWLLLLVVFFVTHLERVDGRNCWTALNVRIWKGSDGR